MCIDTIGHRNKVKAGVKLKDKEKAETDRTDREHADSREREETVCMRVGSCVSVCMCVCFTMRLYLVPIVFLLYVVCCVTVTLLTLWHAAAADGVHEGAVCKVAERTDVVVVACVPCRMTGRHGAPHCRLRTRCAVGCCVCEHLRSPARQVVDWLV